MSLWKILKGLRFKQLASLIGLFFKHPLFMFSTVRATLITMRIAQKEFPDIHGNHNKANAFRHALWNILIAKKCARFSKNTNSILDWTKQITDWHEEFSPNEELAKTMDLHNNKIGRDLFVALSDKTTSEIVEQIKDQLEHSVKIVNSKDVQQYSHQLVYIED